MLVDDLGYAVPLPSPPRRVVSLVPSLTEAIAVSAPGRLVGATDWCIRPAGLTVERVRGTKNPDLARIAGLRPDLVVANEEENRPADVAALRAEGIPVWVTDVRTVGGALASLGRLLDLLDAPERGWLDAAHAAWGEPRSSADGESGADHGGQDGAGAGADGRERAAYPPVVATAVVAVWRRPWMWLGRDTYAGDVLRRLGVATALASQEQRYPRVELTDLPPHDLVVLPDEPYRFTATDGPDAFPGRRVALVDGQALTWYGPRMVGAPGVLRAALTAAGVPVSPPTAR